MLDMWPAAALQLYHLRQSKLFLPRRRLRSARLELHSIRDRQSLFRFGWQRSSDSRHAREGKVRRCTFTCQNDTQLTMHQPIVLRRFGLLLLMRNQVSPIFSWDKGQCPCGCTIAPAIPMNARECVQIIERYPRVCNSECVI